MKEKDREKRDSEKTDIDRESDRQRDGGEGGEREIANDKEIKEKQTSNFSDNFYQIIYVIPGPAPSSPSHFPPLPATSLPTPPLSPRTPAPLSARPLLAVMFRMFQNLRKFLDNPTEICKSSVPQGIMDDIRLPVSGSRLCCVFKPSSWGESRADQEQPRGLGHTDWKMDWVQKGKSRSNR